MHRDEANTKLWKHYSSNIDWFLLYHTSQMSRARSKKKKTKNSNLIEPLPLFSGLKRRKKSSDVQVLCLLNNYANKAICRHEGTKQSPSCFGNSLSSFSPNSDFIIQLHILHISRSSFFVVSSSAVATKRRMKNNLIWLISKCAVKGWYISILPRARKTFSRRWLIACFYRFSRTLKSRKF